MDSGTSATEKRSLGRALSLLGALGLGAVVLATLPQQEASGHQTCSGTHFVITGTSGNDILDGDNDGIGIHDHLDDINGLAGDDDIDGLSCADDLHGGTGSDEMHGGWGWDDLWGGDGDDGPFDGGYLILGEDNDWGNGEDGEDHVWVGSTSQSDSDELLGGPNDDTVDSADTDGNDAVYGNGGSDKCFKDGNDTKDGCELP